MNSIRTKHVKKMSKQGDENVLQIAFKILHETYKILDADII